MDEEELKKILSGADLPAADDNARKAATNLALAAFDDAQKERKNKFQNKTQGFRRAGRLMNSSDNKRRRTVMNKNLVYGGLSTALVLVLATGASMNYLGQHAKDAAPSSLLASASSSSPSSSSISAVYKNAIQERNEQNVQTAMQKGGSAIPVPMSAPPGPVSDRLIASTQDFKKESYNGAPAALVKTKSASLAEFSTADAPAPMAGPVGVVVEDETGVPAYKDVGRDQFAHFQDNEVKQAAQEPVSTFSIDVNTSSYSFIRRQLNEGVLPQKDAVRVEEMVNYFDYNYPLPETKAEPFKPSVAVEPCPWKAGDKLIHIGIKGYDIAATETPRSNLVFLIDTSGSMDSPDKLPLVVQSLKLLLGSLKPDDTVGIVTYAGVAGTALEPTKVSDKDKIIAALDNLGAGGSTAGAEGIRQAYNLAEAHFDKSGVNRVVLATDGDFNVGITNHDELKGFIERERATGIFLSILEFGSGNLNDMAMQELAQNGNGAAAYIDTLNEARKVLVQEATSTLFPIAKDVKIQVEFNPATVAEYRLIGYETRILNREDFNNDKVDAGDIGAGHAVTALYEITPKASAGRMVDETRYQVPAAAAKTDSAFGGEYAFLKIRYKLPDQDVSKLMTTPIAAQDTKTAGDDVEWATAVAEFGQLLRGGQYTGALTYDDVLALAQAHKGADEYGYRSEFIQLVRMAKSAPALPKN